MAGSDEKDQYVIIKYESKYFPGIIVVLNDNKYFIKAMKKVGDHWKWPSIDDDIWYDFNEIISLIAPPKAINKRGLYLVPEMGSIV